MDFLEIAGRILQFAWMVSPIVLVNRLNLVNKKMRILISAESWAKENFLQIINIGSARFRCGRGPSTIWFQAQDDSGKRFEICLEQRWIPSLPFRKHEYKTEFKTKTLL